MRAFLKSLGLLSVTVLAYLVLLEIAVRYVIDDGMQYDLEMWKHAQGAGLEQERVAVAWPWLLIEPGARSIRPPL